MAYKKSKTRGTFYSTNRKPRNGSKVRNFSSNAVFYDHIRSLSGLVAYYPLNEATGNAINHAPATIGTLPATVANVTTQVAGQVGLGYSFNGTSSAVIAPDDDGLESTTFTYMVVINPAGEGDRTIFGTSSTGGPQARLNSNTIQYLKEGVAEIKRSIRSFANGTPYIVFVTNDAETGEMKFVINDTLDRQELHAQTFTMSQFQLGKFAGGGDWGNGVYQHTALFNRVLTMAEMRTIATLAGLNDKWAVSPGITYNYSGDGSDLTADIEFLRYKFPRIRLLFIDWFAGGALWPAWKTIAQTFLNNGFEVIFGPTGIVTNTTSTNWSDYSDFVLDFAAWCQEQNNPNLSCNIGNEEELHHDGTITDAQLRTNLRTLATAVQAVYTAGPVSYSCGAYDAAIINGWGSEGIGDLDYISWNVYGGSDTDDFVTFKSFVDTVYTNFGANTYISEVGTAALGYSSITGISESLWATGFTNRLAYLKYKGIKKIDVYTFMDAADDFGLKKVDGTLRPAWHRVADHLL